MSKATQWGPVLRGLELGPYTAGDCIGEGNFCLVLEAESSSHSRRVALKVLEPNSKAEDKLDFNNEGVLLHKLVRSRAVVDIIETRTDVLDLTARGVPVQLDLDTHVLELADGVLEELLESDEVRQDWDWSERLAYWRSCVLGIHEMHLKHVAHRDLKSSNCLLFLKNKDAPCKVSDLGRARDLSKLAHLPPEAYLVGRGDVRFAPPELLWLMGEADNDESHLAADHYALGSLLFEIATGQGLTAAALPTPREEIEAALKDRAAGNRRDLSALRPRYEMPLAHFREACPPAIRNEAADLIRQLCDPVPSARGPKTLGNRTSHEPGLNWLIRRADILQKRLKHNARSTSKKAIVA